MSKLADALPDVLAANESSLESALAACGWKPQGRTCWRLKTQPGNAFLMEVSHRDHWRQFQLTGGTTPRSTNSRVLQDNFGLFGPAKLIARPGDCPICRLDVPEELTASIGESIAFSEDFQVLDARVAWAQAVTALATGNFQPEKAAPASDAAIVAQLKQAGWSASVDDGRAIIHLQMPGVYRQLRIEYDQPVGVKLATDLIDIFDLKDECLRAMLLLAQEANARLPLVRMAVAESSQSITLRAEVSFGAQLIAGSLLLDSLHVFETAVALTARELEALRDAELARLVLSAAAVRNSAGQD